MSVSSAAPGKGGANSMGMKGSNVGIWAQAGKAIKAGTAVKAERTFAPMPPCPAFRAAAERAEAEAALAVAA